jgi:hypothetical protein
MSKEKHWNMTADELAKATKAFDKPNVIDESRPLTEIERKDWRRVKKITDSSSQALRHKRKFPLKACGSINWVFGTPNDALDHPVPRAFLRSKDQIILDCECEGIHYQVSLKRTSGCRFEGRFDGQRGNETSPVEASCTLYSNETSYFLFGKSLEGNYETIWSAELRPVEHFDDEKKS